MTTQETPEPGADHPELIAEFQARMAGVDGLKQTEITGVLRHVAEKRAIFRGLFDGSDAVLRFYLANSNAYAKRDWEELQRVAPFMADWPNRVSQPLFHAPELGLVITTYEEGQPMLQRLWQSEKPDRLQYMRPAADWLLAYMEPTIERRPIAATNWVAKAERQIAKQAFPRLRPLMEKLLEDLKRIAPKIEGKMWRVARGHGDFHPNNLLVHPNGLTGIDLGGSARMPINKDMGRFLVHMGRHGIWPSDEHMLGVDMGLYEGFIQAFDLNRAERELALPFMIGIEAMLRVETQGLKRGRVRRSEEFYKMLCRDMREVGR